MIMAPMTVSLLPSFSSSEWYVLRMRRMGVYLITEIGSDVKDMLLSSFLPKST